MSHEFSNIEVLPPEIKEMIYKDIITEDRDALLALALSARNFLGRF